MATDEVETVLAAWIEHVLSPVVPPPPEDFSPSTWVAARFAEWWRECAGDTLAEAERAATAVAEELTRLGGWEPFGEALHELAHLRDALSELRGLMRLSEKADA